MGIRQYYKDLCNKPSEFHRVSELFSSTLLNFTLYLAILAFSLQAMGWLIPNSSVTGTLSAVVSKMRGLPPIETFGDVFNLAIVIILLMLFFGAFFMLVFVFVNWIIVNIVRKHKKIKPETTIVIKQSCLDGLSKKVKEIKTSKEMIDKFLQDIDDKKPT